VNIEPVLATDHDRARAISTIVSAFVDDPVERWVFGDGYQTRFPAFVAAFAGDAFDQETVWRLGDFHAVAMWLAPNIEPNEARIVSVLSEAVAPQRQEDLFEVLEQMAQAHPTHPHWYLPWLGVEHHHQGSGLGGRLLQLCLTSVDEEQMPAYLESPNPRNVPFYERYGFEVTAISQAGTCPPVTSMFREARP
jgi:ribosomal protein S18 acetylase RimI-like enzyme